MSDTDALAGEPFHFRTTKEGQVLVSAEGRIVKILKGREAAKFLARADVLDGRDLQLLMAKVTGQFKFGNERG